ncbi:MAG: DUF5703 domain-containing protein, partial [Prevotellaceae bacterium]|nr:DUF5703 domain-containing protein [Prevotellaceae bacterium]
MKKRFCFYLISALAFALPGCSDKTNNVSQYNVVWDTPSENSFGSMPLGNGDIGLNVWCEKNGDLLFYISKVDAYDAGHKLPKLGRIRIKTEPALSTVHFKQTLSLSDASMLIESDDARFKIWVDANNPVIRVEGNSTMPRIATLCLETLRPLHPLPELDKLLSGKGTVGIVFDTPDDKLAWCYRNLSSQWAENLQVQNTPELVAKTKDPILHRTSGCLLQADGFVKESPAVLKSKDAVTGFGCAVKVVSTQPESPETWLAEASAPFVSDWKSHCDYWKSFWERSYIHVTSCGKGMFNFDQCRYTQFIQGSKAYEGHKEIAAGKNARQLSERYALERFCEAAAGRGAVPPPFNGSIFTMDTPAGVAGFYTPVDKPASPDERDWAHLSFMWQNTRHPYFAMAARGDYDALRPGMQFVRDGLEICKDRCKKYFGHEGAFIMEA